MKRWDITLDLPPAQDALIEGCVYAVVERDDASGRTARIIGRRLSHEEALAIANSREALSALGGLWEAIHREDHEDYFDSELVGPELKAAFDVLMKAKGVRV